MADDVDRATIDTTEDPQPADDGGAEDRPEWLPEQFDNPEDLAKSYSELRTKMSQGESPEDSPEEQDEDLSSDDLRIEEVEEEAEDANFDLNQVTEEYAEDGEISDETYEAFEEATGLDRSSLDQHIAGQEALAAQQVSRMAEIAGSRENLQSVLEWAAANVPEDQVASYNAALDEGRLNDAELAMQGIVRQYESAAGRDPNLVGGETTGSVSGVKPFKSSAEVTEAMSDERYKTDPAYRQKVADRLAKSEGVL